MGLRLQVYVSLLGGSWVVISRVISPLIWVISIVTLLIALLILPMNLQVWIRIAHRPCTVWSSGPKP